MKRTNLNLRRLPVTTPVPHTLAGERGAERLIGLGFRYWVAGYKSGDIDRWEEAWRIYAKALKPIFEAKLAKGAAHITGGGLVENTPRALPDHLAANFNWNAWTRPPVFEWLQATGGVPEEDMRRTFNLGIGMVLIVAPAHADDVVAKLKAGGEAAFKIGTLKSA